MFRSGHRSLAGILLPFSFRYFAEWLDECEITTKLRRLVISRQKYPHHPVGFLYVRKNMGNIPKYRHLGNLDFAGFVTAAFF